MKILNFYATKYNSTGRKSSSMLVRTITVSGLKKSNLLIKLFSYKTPSVITDNKANSSVNECCMFCP